MAEGGDGEAEEARPDLRSVLVTSVLNLEPLDEDLYRGRHYWVPSTQRLFGGQIVGQALVAAARSVADDVNVHSLHCYFVRKGNPEMAVLYQVERTRTGNSFSVRSVKALQGGQPIFICQASFQRCQPSPLRHQFSMPAVPPPEDLPDHREVIADFLGDPDPREEYRPGLHRIAARDVPIEMKTVGPGGGGPRPRPEQMFWVRARGHIGEGDAKLHCCVAAYISDYALLGTALLPQRRRLAVTFLASLDHAMWFHAPFRADRWMLYECRSPWAGPAAGRGGAQGRRGGRRAPGGGRPPPTAARGRRGAGRSGGARRKRGKGRGLQAVDREGAGPRDRGGGASRREIREGAGPRGGGASRRGATRRPTGRGREPPRGRSRGKGHARRSAEGAGPRSRGGTWKGAGPRAAGASAQRRPSSGRGLPRAGPRPPVAARRGPGGVLRPGGSHPRQALPPPQQPLGPAGGGGGAGLRLPAQRPKSRSPAPVGRRSAAPHPDSQLSLDARVPRSPPMGRRGPGPGRPLAPPKATRLPSTPPSSAGNKGRRAPTVPVYSEGKRPPPVERLLDEQQEEVAEARGAARARPARGPGSARWRGRAGRWSRRPGRAAAAGGGRARPPRAPGPDPAAGGAAAPGPSGGGGAGPEAGPGGPAASGRRCAAEGGEGARRRDLPRAPVSSARRGSDPRAPSPRGGLRAGARGAGEPRLTRGSSDRPLASCGTERERERERGRSEPGAGSPPPPPDPSVPLRPLLLLLYHLPPPPLYPPPPVPPDHPPPPLPPFPPTHLPFSSSSSPTYPLLLLSLPSSSHSSSSPPPPPLPLILFFSLLLLFVSSSSSSSSPPPPPLPLILFSSSPPPLLPLLLLLSSPPPAVPPSPSGPRPLVLRTPRGRSPSDQTPASTGNPRKRGGGPCLSHLMSSALPLSPTR
uniref:Acyl-CoA thioesterase 8 n=1 Tax=Ornithorhynchus anatinus TaxID=9258 RepID=A0A6I8NL50_ORNAN